MKHKWEKGSPCLYCNDYCRQCNDCSCPDEKNKDTDCPNFDTKAGTLRPKR